MRFLRDEGLNDGGITLKKNNILRHHGIVLTGRQLKGVGTRRRSTIGVHPIFSEASSLKGAPLSHPKTDFSKNQIASRRTIPWPESTKRFCFSIKIGIPTISGRESPPRLSETK